MQQTLQHPLGARAIGRVSQPQANPAQQPSYVAYGTRRLLIVAGVMLAALLQTVDATIVNVALPTIQGNLGASVDEATWVVTSYVITNVVVIPLTPWLLARLGRKRYFLISIAGFTIASVLCGLATSLSALIAFRVVQGAFGGGLLPVAQVILRETFPPELLGTSQSIFALGAILGPSVGPTLGGIMTDNLAWQWVFDINIVPGVLAFVVLFVFLRESPPRRSTVDFAGIALLTATIASLQYVLDQGQHDDWFSNGGICIATVVAVISGVAFVFWELRTRQPIVDLRILARPAIAGASLVAMGNAAGIYGVLLLLPQFTVSELGFTSTLAGFLIGLRALPIALLTIPIGRIVNGRAIDPRLFVGGGLALSAAGTYMLSQSVASIAGLAQFATGLMLSGLGIACIFTPTLVAALRSVAPSDAPKASAFITLFSQLGGSIAVAAFVAIFDRREALHLDHIAATMTRGRIAVDTFVAHYPLAQLAGLSQAQAALLAYRDVFVMMAIVVALSVPAAILIAPRRTS